MQGEERRGGGRPDRVRAERGQHVRDDRARSQEKDVVGAVRDGGIRVEGDRRSPPPPNSPR